MRASSLIEAEVSGVQAQQADGPASEVARAFSRRYFALGFCCVLLLGLGYFYTQKDRYSDRVASLSRSLIGDENTARVESWYFAVQDRYDRLKYSVFGGETNPFGDDEPLAAATDAHQSIQPIDALAYVHIARPSPLPLPQTKALHDSPAPGEGLWTTAGLPRSTPDDVLMAKTFIRPDSARPYAVVGVLLVDKRRMRLHMTGGTEDPGGDRGVKGPGVIPEGHRGSVLAAWNGGFRGPHGGYGMYADGRQYRPLRSGFASLVLLQDGSMRMGEWGKDVTWSPDIEAVRQNAVLLVDKCEVSARTKEGNNTWGYVKVDSSEFITWRSAVGLTANGDLLVAAGNSLSADSLARALWAAGACYAMQLDINTPYVLTSLYTPQADGTLKASKFMDSMADGPGRFMTVQKHDFMYVTLDEENFVP
jgi:hypothetical protein